MNVMKQFEECVERKGFGLAVIIYQDKLSEEFYAGMGFKQWQKIYYAADEEPFKQITLEGMCRTAEDLKEYSRIEFYVLKESKREKAALERPMRMQQFIEANNRALQYDQMIKDVHEKISEFPV